MALRRSRRNAVGTKDERMKWRMIFISGISIFLVAVVGMSTHPQAIELTNTAKGYLPRALRTKPFQVAPLVRQGTSRMLFESQVECVTDALVQAQAFNDAEVVDQDGIDTAFADLCIPRVNDDPNELFIVDIDLEDEAAVALFALCDINEEFEACCEVNDDGEFVGDCFTIDEIVCDVEEICVAELIPGSGVGGQCLSNFELDGGGIPVYIFLLIYLFLALAIVCDDYFSYALDMLGDLLGMTPDVKGATFAAIGSSAPELFVSLADNVIANPPKSVGVGTIVGSAIFNILVIIGASAVVAGRKFGFVKLNWRPLMRDSAFYVLSIIGLITVAITGDEALNYEGAILVLVYVGYLVFMAFNRRIFAFIDARFLGIKPTAEDDEVVPVDDDKKDEDPEDDAEKKEDEDDGEAKDFLRQGTDASKVGGGSSRMNLKRGATMGSRSRKGSAVGKGMLEEDENVEDQPYFSVLYWPQYNPYEDQEEVEGVEPPKASFGTRYCGGGLKMWLRRAYFLLVFPINLVFRFTIPDSRYDLFCEDKRSGKKDHRPIAYWLEFLMCIIHIGLASHFLVYSAAKFGCLANIDPAVMGLTVLAAGTSVPDMITSVILTRNGEGDAAVANSIGSNVFDILIGLGLPWFIAGFVYGGSDVATDDIGIAIGFLFGVLVVLVGALLITGFKLNTFIGVFLLVLYGAYVAFELIRAGVDASE